MRRLITQHARKFAEREGRRTGRAPEVTVTGHSLGGTLAEITAHHFGLRGETFDSFGAVSLNRRIPEGGDRLINHVTATDVVSAASPHYGQVRLYAMPEEIERLQGLGAYENNTSRFDIRRPIPPAAISLTPAHKMHHFLNVDGEGRPDVSLLRDPQAQRLAAQYAPMIDKYRDDIGRIRAGTTLSMRGAAGLLGDAIDHVRGDLQPGEPARLEAEAARLAAQGHVQEPVGPARGEAWRRTQATPLPDFLMPNAPPRSPIELPDYLRPQDGADTTPVAALEPLVVRPSPESARGVSAPSQTTGMGQASATREKERPAAPARTAADPGHPDHALLETLRGLVRRLDQQAGKGWDESSERLSASALVMAKRQGFTERDELHLGFNRPTDKHAAGEVLHLARTGPHTSADPAANRIHMSTAEALSKPAAERYQQVQDIARQQELERQQTLARGPDEPSRSGPAR